MKTRMKIDRDFWRMISALAMPIALQNLLASTAGMLDTVMVSSVGELAMASVSICNTYWGLYGGFAYSFSGGAIMFLSQYWGAQDQKGMNRTFGMGISFMMFFALTFSAVAFIAPEAVLSIYTDKSSIIAMGAPYMRMVSLSYPINAITTLLTYWMRSTERVKPIVISSITAMGTNLVMNWLLIYGRFGLPKMGVTGAAVATLISACVNLLLLVVLMGRSKCSIQLKVSDMGFWENGFVGQYVKKSIPIVCNEVLVALANNLIGMVMGRQAESEIAAYAAINTMAGFAFAFFGGFGDAGVVLIGKKTGAGKHMEGYGYMKTMSVFCALITGASCLIMVILNKPLLGLFHLSEEAMHHGFYMLCMYTVHASLAAFACFLNSTFRAGGDTVTGSVIRISMIYLLSVIPAWITGIWLKAPFLVVYGCALLYEVGCSILQGRHAWSGRWIRPITENGQATIEAFREELKVVRVRKNRWGKRAAE